MAVWRRKRVRDERYWRRVAARATYPIMARLAIGLALIGIAATLAAVVLQW